MLKMVIKNEIKTQGIDRAALLDGICTEGEFAFWEQEEIVNEEELLLGVMQVHALAQRLGKSAGKYDSILDEEEMNLAKWRSEVGKNVRNGELEAAEKRIAEYEKFLCGMEKNLYDRNLHNENPSDKTFPESQKKTAGDKRTLPYGEIALHRQFLALSQAEIARRQKLPYKKQLERILGGLRQTIPETAWEKRQDKLYPSREWFRTRRFHLMEQFLLVRFVQVWECMGQEKENGEAFLWYQELAAYALAAIKDQADLRKVHPLLCYRMAENRLHRMFGEDAWWQKEVGVGFPMDAKTITFAQAGTKETEKFQNAAEYMQILENLTEGLKRISLSQKNYPLFRKMENMRLALLRNMPLFGEHTLEEKRWNLLEDAWREMCRIATNTVCESTRNFQCNANIDMEAIDMDYTERSIHNFTELLGRRMELHDWDIYKLGDTIYADPKKSLTPILKGKASPKKKKRKLLQERLGISWKQYDPGFLTDDDAEYKKYARMARAYNDGRIEEGKKLLEELEEKIDWEYSENEQFAQYWDALFAWRNGEITDKQKNDEMWKILEYSGIKREKFTEIGCSLSRREWRALIEIVWGSEKEDMPFLCQVMKKQKEYLEETGKEGLFPEYYIKILYCLSSMECEMGNLDEAEQYVNKGLSALYKMNLYTQWGALLFMKFRITKSRKDEGMERDDFAYIRQAYAVEKLFLRSNNGCKAMERYLEGSHEEDMLADIK